MKYDLQLVELLEHAFFETHTGLRIGETESTMGYLIPMVCEAKNTALEKYMYYKVIYDLSFLSHKINFVTLCFRPFLPKIIFFFFFLRSQEILYFLCVLDPGDHFTKSRPASGVLRTKL